MPAIAILVVEDERIIAKGIEKQLKDMGYVISWSAANGEEAVKKALELKPDLILMDIALGAGIDGVEAAEQIRKHMDVPVVFLTANSDESTRQRAILTDPFGYVLKPYEEKDLQTAIEIGLYRHKMEWRLRENEQWLAATLSSIGDGVIATDEHGSVRLMNSLAEQLTGWKIQEAMGKNIADVFRIINEMTREPAVNPVEESIRIKTQTKLQPDTILIDRYGNERNIDDTAAPIINSKGMMVGVVLVFRDVTEHRRLEDHLRQAQKMEAIGRLAGGIAHDFNNIMTIITGYSELLLAGGQPEGDREEFMKSIQDAGQRAAALTQQIMAFSRKQVLVPSVLNLNSVIRDIGVMVKRLIGSNIEFQTLTAGDLGQVKADPTQLGQVILNLATNARDAMPNGGKLIISTQNAELSESMLLKWPDVKPGRYVLMSVADNGVGMTEKVMAHIFDPFFTTKKLGEGTGLGLATVHGIIKQSGGQIEVESEIGKGTTFKIYLPVVEEAVAPAVKPAAPQTAKGNETILLVEDEQSVRMMMMMILQRSGYQILEASNGQEALDLIAKYTGPIHLVMTDLVMPHLSGRELVERLIVQLPHIKVLFMSGYTEDMIVHQGVESASVNFLHKPFTLASLSNKVREVLDKE